MSRRNDHVRRLINRCSLAAIKHDRQRREQVAEAPCSRVAGDKRGEEMQVTLPWLLARIVVDTLTLVGRSDGVVIDLATYTACNELGLQNARSAAAISLDDRAHESVPCC